MQAWRTMAAATAAVLLSISACSGESASPVDGEVIQPGRPGDDSEILDEAPVIEPDRANEADVMFVQMMIPHHAQALEMAELAPDAGGSDKVAAIADRINGAQRPEIVFMANWLTDQGLDAPTKEQIDAGTIPMGSGHEGHGSGAAVHDMPGMATEAQLDELADATGTDFDRLFLELMINHHQGAVDMVNGVVSDGADLQINELATGIAADQLAEIQRMRDLYNAL